MSTKLPSLGPQTVAERAWASFLFLKIHGLLNDTEGVRVRRRFARIYPGVSIGLDGREVSRATGKGQAAPAEKPADA